MGGARAAFAQAPLGSFGRGDGVVNHAAVCATASPIK
jgi:hypothetical protein